MDPSRRNPTAPPSDPASVPLWDTQSHYKFPQLWAKAESKSFAGVVSSCCHAHLTDPFKQHEGK